MPRKSRKQIEEDNLKAERLPRIGGYVRFGDSVNVFEIQDYSTRFDQYLLQRISGLGDGLTFGWVDASRVIENFSAKFPHQKHNRP